MCLLRGHLICLSRCQSDSLEQKITLHAGTQQDAPCNSQKGYFTEIGSLQKRQLYGPSGQLVPIYKLKICILSLFATLIFITKYTLRAIFLLFCLGLFPFYALFCGFCVCVCVFLISVLQTDPCEGHVSAAIIWVDHFGQGWDPGSK